MPSIANWFSGPALAAFLVFVGAGYGWYRAAVTAQESADEKISKKEKTESAERLAVYRQLTQEYMLSHDSISPKIAAGLELPPSDWMNTRLAELGRPWRLP